MSWCNNLYPIVKKQEKYRSLFINLKIFRVSYGYFKLFRTFRFNDGIMGSVY